MAGHDDPAGSDFHLDKRIPVVLIGAMVVQVMIFGFGAGVLLERFNARFERGEVRLTIIETRLDAMSGLPTDIAVIKAQITSINDTLDRIEDDLTAERQRRKP
jgi:hypothetical protein